MTSDHDDGHGVSRRKILECMTWAGTGVLWTIAGGMPHSSTLSRIDVGTSRPSALAVVILSTVSYFTDNCKGRSAGFSLSRMRST
jgi:hypothetical protein